MLLEAQAGAFLSGYVRAMCCIPTQLPRGEGEGENCGLDEGRFPPTTLRLHAHTLSSQERLSVRNRRDQAGVICGWLVVDIDRKTQLVVCLILLLVPILSQDQPSRCSSLSFCVCSFLWLTHRCCVDVVRSRRS